jgi:hypothetical protein
MMGHANPETTAGYAAFDNASAVTAVEALPTPSRLRAVPLDERAAAFD